MDCFFIRGLILETLDDVRYNPIFFFWADIGLIPDICIGSGQPFIYTYMYICVYKRKRWAVVMTAGRENPILQNTHLKTVLFYVSLHSFVFIFTFQSIPLVISLCCPFAADCLADFLALKDVPPTKRTATARRLWLIRHSAPAASQNSFVVGRADLLTSSSSCAAVTRMDIDISRDAAHKHM